MNPRVAIAILNWNGKNFLHQFLPSVKASTYPNLEICVIDNASTDDSISFLQAEYPGIRVIRNAQNFGFAQGYNEGLKQVDADIYVLLNSDVEVTPGWIEPIVALMETHPGIGACQPKILQYAQKDHFEYAGAAGGWIDLLGYPFSRGRVFDTCEADHGQYDTPAPVFWASGACLFIRSACFKSQQGFDPFFFAHMEEIDLCWRLQAAGHEVYCCPQSVVYHVGGGTLPKGNSLKVYLNFRNNLIMLAKNLPLREALWVIPLRFGLDALTAWKGLVTGDPGYFRAIVRAHLGLFQWALRSRHQSPLPPQKMIPRHGVYRGSIVWKYFMSGKKSFREIVA